MSKRHGMALAGIALALVLSGPGATTAGARVKAGADNTLRIGLVGSLFRDAPESMVRAVMQPFATVMEAQTGRTGELVNGGDALHLGGMLANGKADLGVFHGIEFAWAQQKYPELQPLVVAVNRQSHLYAVVLVRCDSKAERLADLKGRSLAVPRFTREHCYVFLERHCGRLADFFGKITRPANIERALDDLVDGKVEAVVADGVGLASYQKRKPARFDRLRALKKSEVFPATVIAYRKGAFDPATIQRFREGLLGVGGTAIGRQLLTLWQITAFEAVPDDYRQTVAEIVKAYPPPESSTEHSVLRPPTGH